MAVKRVFFIVVNVDVVCLMLEVMFNLTELVFDLCLFVL